MEEKRVSRYEKQDKRRKANIVLNILIGIVAILIVLVAYQLLVNPPSNEQATSDQESESNAPASNEQNQPGEGDANENENSNEQDSQANEDKEEGSDVQPNSEDPFAGAEITEGGSSSDVTQTIVNPNWKAVGTEQTGEHVATYDQNSQDWKEMLKAASYATGVPEDRMTVNWIGNNGGPQAAKATISDKESGEKFRVEIAWEDGNGWKPTKVEKLKS